MRNIDIARICRIHGINVRFGDASYSRIEAHEVANHRSGESIEDVSHWVDVTGWTAGRLYKWLGY